MAEALRRIRGAAIVTVPIGDAVDQVPPSGSVPGPSVFAVGMLRDAWREKRDPRLEQGHVLDVDWRDRHGRAPFFFFNVSGYMSTANDKTGIQGVALQ